MRLCIIAQRVMNYSARSIRLTKQSLAHGGARVYRFSLFFALPSQESTHTKQTK